jgi:hypothetical protein
MPPARRRDGGEDERGEDDAERVCDDRLAFERRAHAPVDPDLLQDRRDDRRPRHGDYRAEEEAQLPRPAEQHAREQPRERRRYQEAEAHQTDDRARRVAQLAYVQEQPALEDDDGHGRAYYDAQRHVQRLRLDEPQHGGAKEQARDEQRPRRRDAQTLGQNLRRGSDEQHQHERRQHGQGGRVLVQLLNERL